MKNYTLLIALLITFSAFAQKDASKKYNKELSKLTKDKSVQAAMEHIQMASDKDVEILINLTEIEAPPFKEEKRARVYAEMLEKAGADSVWIDEVGNVLALRKGTDRKRVIALDAHLDTVFPEGTDVTVQMKGDTLVAPGIGDDTRGLVIVHRVLQALESANIETSSDILFIGTVGEEGLGDLRGVKHLFREGGPQIDTWISVDGGNISRVNNKGLGSYRYRITFKGPGGHSWGAFGLGSPIHALGTAIDYFTQAADKFTASGDRTSYNVGRIGGGTSVNSIAFEAWMEVDMRSVSPNRLNQIDKILKESVQKALVYHNDIKREGPDLTVDVDKIGDRPSGELSDDLPLVQRSMAISRYFGAEPRLTRGSTNSNIPISRGIPSVTIGRGGRGGGAHSLDEWWMDVDGYKAGQSALLHLLVSDR